MKQVIPYCVMAGASLAIICNGPQLAIFLPVVLGKNPMDGFCIIFNGFESYVREFPRLWELLSPEGIADNRAYRRLKDRQNIRIPAKGSAHIPEPRRTRYRSELQTELREIGSFLLEEIEDNPEIRSEFYEECYVPVEANNRHLLLSKQVISSRYARVSDTGSAPSALEALTSGGKIADTAFIGAGSKPIVVIGDVGVGKSSFFENLFLQLSEQDKENTLYITIDLGISATMTDNIKEHVVEHIPTILLEDYGIDIEDSEFVRSIYDADLKRFEKIIKGQVYRKDSQEWEKACTDFLIEKASTKINHLKNSLLHLAKGRKNKIVLIIDNADQRDFETQQSAFLIAQEFASTRALFVFVALRPSTFYLSKMSGALSAYQNRILTISPPPADEVIQRRLTFALRVAEGDAKHAALRDVQFNLSSIVLFLRALLRSVRKVDRIRRFLGNITGGNTKAVIELVTSFVGSPNVEAAKIVRIEDFEGNYHVPYHEFTKHALLGQYSYYNPESSLVACNLFDVSASDPREHFLMPLIVGFLSSSNSARDNDGFYHGSDILREMQLRGFGDEQIRFALKRLASKKLIETPYSHYREVTVEDDKQPEQFSFRATSVGIYHIRYWMGEFSYLDAVAIDTPVFDEETRETIAKKAASFKIEDRLRKTVRFRDYLRDVWRTNELSTSYLQFETVLELAEKDFDLVEAEVRKFTTKGRPTKR